MTMEQLKLFNVGWECKGNKPPADNYFTCQYHQIGNMRVFAYSAWEAYDYALIELGKRHKARYNVVTKSYDKITITIPFVEEIQSVLGVSKERETTWDDAYKRVDWLKQRENAMKINVNCKNCDLVFPVEQIDSLN
jgi:hypothetical protein